VRTLGRQGGQIELAADAREAARLGWPGGAPVLRTPELAAGVLADGRVRVELPAQGRQSGLQVLLQLWPDAGGSRSEGDLQLSQPLLICQAGVLDQLSCASFGPPADSGADEGAGEGGRFTVVAAGWHEQGRRLVELSREGRRLGLAALAPVGDEGSFLMLQVGAASLFRAVGGPMLLAMLLLSGLALLGAGWSYWRQLPRLRRLYLSHAQAQATLRHLPLATLVLDAQQRVIRVNPAAEQLLAAPASHWLGLPVPGLLPDWTRRVELSRWPTGLAQPQPGAADGTGRARAG
jgi:PAS domain-containing protein